METVGMSIANKRYTTRGFLIGPYCPVYGVGAVSISLFLRKYLDDPVTLFFMAVILTSFIEYMTSFIMEKLFKARWWDYSHRLFNINGRVCLINSFGFGFLGLALLYIIEPFIENLLNKIPDLLLIILSSVLLIIFIVDVVISCNLVFKIRNNVHLIKKDSTDEISKKVRQALDNHTRLVRRIFSAFPRVKLLNSNISTTTFKQALEKLELENKQAKLKWKDTKQQLKLKLKKKELKEKKKELKKNN